MDLGTSEGWTARCAVYFSESCSRILSLPSYFSSVCGLMTCTFTSMRQSYYNGYRRSDLEVKPARRSHINIAGRWMSGAFFTMKLQTLLSMQRSFCSVKGMGLTLRIMRDQTRDQLLKVFAFYGNRLNKPSSFGLYDFFFCSLFTTITGMRGNAAVPTVGATRLQNVFNKVHS